MLQCSKLLCFFTVRSFFTGLDKHTSFLSKGINYGCIKFYDTDPGQRQMLQWKSTLSKM
jgi:hypothetical protein